MATVKTSTRTYVNCNKLEFSGRIVKDAEIYEGPHGQVARFRIAHNTGKNSKGENRPAVFMNAVMASGTGDKAVALPLDLLKKGIGIVASGYLRNADYEKDGKKFYGTDFVVTSVESIESILAAAKAEAEEQTAE